MRAPAIRILHTVFSLDPGGMENGIVNIVNALDPERFEVSVCCLESRGAFADRLPPAVEVSVLTRKPKFSLELCRKLRGEILRKRPHLIHSHNLGPLIYSGIATFGGITAPILQGEHAELTPHDLDPFRLQMRRWLYGCCRAVHSVGHGLHRQLVGLKFSESKLRVIVNGVDTDRFAPATVDERLSRRCELGIPEHAVVAGIVGRFGPFKQHQALIEAFEPVADRMADLHLLVVGGGGPRELAIRELASLSRHSNRIHLTGYQCDPAPFYQAMDLLVVPSTNEGLSNALLEAMANGVPALGHHACGNADVIASGENGILADLSTPERIREALETTLRMVARLPELGAAARRKITLDFSLKKMVKDYETLYSQVARMPS